MTYCTQTDIAEVLPAPSLAALTDDTAGAVVDPVVLAAAIARADAIIDATLGARYAVPLVLPPAPVVVGISVDLTVWELFSRRAAIAEPPKAIAQRQLDALARLANLASGVMPLAGATPALATGSGGSAAVSSATRVFDPVTMDNFIHNLY